MENATADAPCGEIIEVSTTAFVAQCLEVPRASAPRLFDPPDLGAFVRIGPRDPGNNPEMPEETEEEDPFAAPRAQNLGAALLPPNTTYAVVAHARTSSLEPSRRPSALGYEDEDSLRAHQPQIFELLTTEFSGLLIGYTDEDGRLRRHLPPRPPRVHSRVGLCGAREQRALTDDVTFLRHVLSPMTGGLAAAPPDELAAACLRAAWAARGYDEIYIVEAGKVLMQLLADDYDRLQAILRSVL